VKTPEVILANVKKNNIRKTSINISKRSSETLKKLIALISFETSLVIAQHNGANAKILYSLYDDLPLR
jgi:hypothetical protein